MGLRFILGSAGSGKTRRCLAEIVNTLIEDGHDGPPLLFLVPEQATFQMERALLALDERVQATTRARVVSFKRLAQLALADREPMFRARLGELGRLFALQAALERCRDELSLFRRAAATDGFVERMAAVIAEFHAHRHQPERLLVVGDRLDGDGLLQRKVREIARIYQEFERFVGERFFDGERLLDVASEALRDEGSLVGAAVWVDGFSGFTPQEYAVLGAVMSSADQVNVALCLDKGIVEGSPPQRWDEGPEEGLFHPVRQTLVRLVRLAAQESVPVQPTVFLPENQPPRFKAAPALALVERALATDERALFAPVDPASRAELAGESAIAIVEAPHRRAEVEAAARQIVRWVRDEGHAYSDIAVIVRDLAPYQELIETTFASWEIPYFLDVKASAHHHPVVTLLRSALEAVTQGLKSRSILRFLKSDLALVDRDAADRLENFALERGIHDEGWGDAKLWADSDVREAWELAMSPLLEFRAAWARAAGSGERGLAARFVELVWNLLERLDAVARVEAWGNDAMAAGDGLEAQEHAQALSAVSDLLEQVAAVLSDSPLSAAEFAQALSAGLKRLRLGRVPPRVDQVLVGSVERSRQPDLACAVLLGCNAGEFPALQREDPIFSDADRRTLSDVGLALAPGSRLRSYHERYLAYIALTRASKAVLLTYSRTDEGGRSLKPSAIVTWISSLMDGVPLQRLPSDRPDDRFPEHRAGVTGWLARAFRAWQDGAAISPDKRTEALSVYDWVRRHEAARNGEQRALFQLPIDPLKALAYANASEPLSAAEVHAIYGERLNLSPSSLETLGACSFQFFASAGLRLRDRQALRLDPSDVGSLSHAVFKRYVEILWQTQREWGSLTRAESDALVEEAVDHALASEASDAFLASAAGKYVLGRTTQALKAAAWAFTRHAKRSRFRPVAVEARFGAGAALPSIALRLAGGQEARISGRIDRLDEAVSDDGRRYVRVIDYKSSPRTFSLEGLVHGIDVQLGAYAAVVMESEEPQGARFAGCLYFPVFDPLSSVHHPGDAPEEAWMNALKASGLIADDGIAPRLMDEEGQGASPIVPLFFRKDGSLGAASSIASPESVAAMAEYVRQWAKSAAERVFAGETAIDPYMSGVETPCGYCDFKAVCQFDPLVPGNGYRRLRRLDEDEAWRAIRQAVEKGGEDRVS